MLTDQNISSNPVLVFDWGDTLMKVYPEYSGPMAGWPQVTETDGAVEALEALLGHFTMAVATNAGDSTAAQVWQALRRVGLGEYFKAVFTSAELGARKPQMAFFRQLESVLARPPYHLVMIGDSYHADVLGARLAGWKAIWYNPRREAAPGLLPLHDAEVANLRDLPVAIARLHLPDVPTCLSWLVERGTPLNILFHVQLVAAVAYQLAVWLGAAGEIVDPVLTHRGALLHDLAKIDSILPAYDPHIQGDHAAMAQRMLLERAQPELAEIAGRHMPYQDPAYPRRPLTWEQKLVHYADKLVDEKGIISTEERFQALKLRYPRAVQELDASWAQLEALQAEICARLNRTPVELVQQLRESAGFRIIRQAG
jgi:putative hydrolase of the HAD superfamily